MPAASRSEPLFFQLLIEKDEPEGTQNRLKKQPKIEFEMNPSKEQKNEPVLASEREARLIRRVLPTCGARSSHRPSQNLHIFEYALNEESLPNTT